MEGIIALLIPIIFTIGLFTAISLNSYFKYKAKDVTTKNVPLESLGEWYKAEAMAKAKRGRVAAFQVGGLLIGFGVGIAVGCMILAWGGIPESVRFDETAIGTFMILGLSVLCGGAGLIGGSMLERKMERRSKEE